MAELIKNELVLEIQDDGSVLATRTIIDKNTKEVFMETVDKQRSSLEFMQKFIENFDEALQGSLMEIRKQNRGKSKAELESKLSTEKMRMTNQKVIFEKRDIPNITKELPQLEEIYKKLQTTHTQ